MRDQYELPGQSHWYSLISVAPRPETGETANVGVVFGNGRAYRLVYFKNLPRLCGLAPTAEVRIYEAVLEHCAEQIERGVDPIEVRAMLAPQMRVRDQVRLYGEPTNEMMDQVANRFLAAPRYLQLATEEAIAIRSSQRLDPIMERAKVSGVLVQKEDVRPNALWGNKIERHIKGQRVPRLARAFRGFGRDVLVDSLSIEQGYPTREVHQIAGRIGEAFWLYNTRLSALLARANVRVKTVGVLYPLPTDAPSWLANLRDFVRDSWSQYGAEVVEGSEQEIETALRQHAEWVREGAA